MLTSMLLKSCAIPPAIRPSASSRCADCTLLRADAARDDGHQRADLHDELELARPRWDHALGRERPDAHRAEALPEREHRHADQRAVTEVRDLALVGERLLAEVVAHDRLGRREVRHQPRVVGEHQLAHALLGGDPVRDRVADHLEAARRRHRQDQPAALIARVLLDRLEHHIHHLDEGDRALQLARDLEQRTPCGHRPQGLYQLPRSSGSM
jgi:hypothetical protein